jgi:hypothetical protein
MALDRAIDRIARELRASAVAASRESEPEPFVPGRGDPGAGACIALGSGNAAALVIRAHAALPLAQEYPTTAHSSVLGCFLYCWN